MNNQVLIQTAKVKYNQGQYLACMSIH